jgi:RNA 2',3'-cyclic 3'-phosphodiesterase
VRLFFALWPDADTRARLAEVAAGLTLTGPGRLVPAANYHLTLNFVGEVPGDRLKRLLLIGAAQQAPRFTITLDASEFWAQPRAVVAAAHEIPPSLHRLWSQLRQALAQDRFGDAAVDSPPLRAHVTLARKVAQAPVLQAMSVLAWRVNSFTLVRSKTGGTGSAYTVLDTWPLLDETKKPEKTL